MPGAAWEHPMTPREHPCVVMRVGEGWKVQDGRTAGGARSEAVWRKGQEGRLQDEGCGLGAGWRRAVVQCILSLCRCCVRSMVCVLRPASCDPAFVHAWIACELRASASASGSKGAAALGPAPLSVLGSGCSGCAAVVPAWLMAHCHTGSIQALLQFLPRAARCARCGRVAQ